MAYIDDLVVKSMLASDHLAHLTEAFKILKTHKFRLNAKKCAFKVSSGKFLGHFVSRRGIEADPAQLLTIEKLSAPHNKKDVQRLTGMAAAFNWFISWSSDKCQPFFTLLKGSRRSFNWTEDCDRAFRQLKAYLSEPLLLVTPRDQEDLFLYLVVSPHTIYSMIVRQEG